MSLNNKLIDYENNANRPADVDEEKEELNQDIIFKSTSKKGYH